jgi:hypothetical protein
MKEYAGCARNVFLSEIEDGKFQPCAEFILLVCEPTFRLGFGNEIVRERSAEQFRFTLTPDSARSLVKRLNDAIEAMESAAATQSPTISAQERETS